ncbi:maleylpyruvate isomerase family mycothiol-dependent enzyme [Actinokineospora soli]
MVAPAFTRELSVDWYVAEFRAEVARFADAVGLLPNTDPVVTCPGWTAADLVRHIRQGHEWAASILESRSPTFLPPAGITEDGGSWTEQVAAVGSSASCTPTDIVHYLAEGSQRLAAAIASVPEGTEIWAPHSPTEFWPRWALFETTVHRGDVCLALGHPYALHRTVALDCIDFCLIGFGQPGARPFLNPAFAEIPRGGQTLRFATETRSWLITCTPSGVTVQRDADGPADVTASATPAELLLLVKSRISPDHPEVTVSGDRDLLDYWLARAIS